MPASITIGIADLIGVVLQAQSQGTVATDIFIGHLPNDPDDAFAILDTEGSEQNHSPIISAGFQLLVRDRTRSDAETKIHVLRNLLRDDSMILWPQSGSGWFIHSVVISDFPFSLGKDQKGRWKFTLNCTANCRRKVS